MKRVIVLATTIVLGLSIALPSFAGRGHSDHAYYEYADVIGVKPITQIVRVDVPRQECWTETHTRYTYGGFTSYTPEIFGAIVGGAIGNRFGSGRGRDIATAAGALLGGSIGHDVKRRHHTYAYREPVERCETRNEYREEERVVGYRVKYRYDGRIYHTRMNDHPGERVRVRVNVTPAD